MSDAALHPAIPDLVFTVAITGHRVLPDGLQAALQGQVRSLLDAVRTRLLNAQHRSELDRGRTTILRFVCALAPVADVIGARAALARSVAAPPEPRWHLNAVLPFARASYAKTAAADLREGKTDEAVIAR